MVVIDVSVTKTQLCVVVVLLMMMMMEVAALNGPNVCMVQQKYNITKRVKYRAPMTVRTYEWCFAMPPRCSKWKTEMRELTKLETDERIAEVAVCCPGYKMKDVSCVPICPNGKSGHRCSENCPENKWGPNCVNDCEPCKSGTCSPITGDCSCQDGWQGESCETRMLPTSTSTTAEVLLTISATKPTPPLTPTIPFTRPASVAKTTLFNTTSTSRPTLLENTTRLSKAKSHLELQSSVLNRNISQNNSTISSVSSISEKPSLIPNQATVLKTIPLLISTTEMPTKLIVTSSSPETPVNIVTTFKTTLAPKTLTTLHKGMYTSTIATTVLATKNIEASLKASTKNKTDDVMKTIQQTVTTSTATFLAKGSIQKATNAIPTTTESEIIAKASPNNVTIRTTKLPETGQPIEQTSRKLQIESKYNRTEVPIMPKEYMKETHIPVHITLATHGIFLPKITNFANVTHMPVTSTAMKTTGTTKIDTTKRPESTIRYFPTTVKFKPKEIWIRPAQKGEPYKSKPELNPDLPTKPRVTQANTTPKTIIVSIIPTSVSYATFKKIALTTASLIDNKTNLTTPTPKVLVNEEVTKSMTSLMATEPSVTKKNINATQKIFTPAHSSKSPHLEKTTKTLSTFHTTREIMKNNTVSTKESNSMTTVDKNLNSSNNLTTLSTNAIRTVQPNITLDTTTKQTSLKSGKVTRPIKIVTVKPRNVTIITVSGKNKNETLVKITKTIATDIEKTNATTILKTNQVTESPDDEEFHILTEPEHITAVMEGKGKDISSVDLISVISIAGGIMMAVITVAVIIVMVERCKKPRYDDVRKISDIRMQVMIDNNDVPPPPYVRSIFHTPLPDPPASEKCHYQPISTLDRNLKQFMRPVVVQTISPIMLENFRGILECHYDHLPRRNHHIESTRHCSIALSTDNVDELDRLRPCNAMESTIEALKCEARLDVIDSTTSEPLYAEIPCWRPPSEHAIEIINHNGEAVTEL